MGLARLRKALDMLRVALKGPDLLGDAAFAVELPFEVGIRFEPWFCLNAGPTVLGLTSSATKAPPPGMHQVELDGIVIRWPTLCTEMRSDRRDGYRALWGWFSLSYAAFLTMPRVLMHAMPDEWQRKMARLLEEYDETYSIWPEKWGTRVNFTYDNKLAKWPDWVLNYRYPDFGEIAKLRARQAA